MSNPSGDQIVNFNLLPLLYLWLALDAVIAGLFGWRQRVVRGENGSVRLVSNGVSEQVATAGKIEQIDKWVKLLTIIAVAFGLLLGAVGHLSDLEFDRGLSRSLTECRTGRHHRFVCGSVPPYWAFYSGQPARASARGWG